MERPWAVTSMSPTGGFIHEPVVEMRGITKRFLDVTANDGVDFALQPGEICALLGENGAGKTTLMNILFGYYASDAGEIRLRGEPVALAAPRDAIAAGVAMIHQHFTLVPVQTVLENVVIGTGRGLFLDLAAARRRLVELAERFGLAVDPDARVWTLSVGEQQRVEILKALYRDAQILIMDEPTAVLTPAESKQLFATLRGLVGEGRSIVFISHKLNEVMEVADRVVVLRGGRVVAERRTAETSRRELALLMVGRDVLERLDKRPGVAGEPRLEILGVSVRGDRGLETVRDLSLTVRSGEIVGLAGVSGNGQRELAEALFGLRPCTHGAVRLCGRPLQAGSPAAAVAAGMARVPEDRMETALAMDLSVQENLVLERHGSHELARRGLLRFAAIGALCERLLAEYSVKAAGRDAAAKTLSGGNLQKLILARELAGEPAVIVAAQPTRGLDVGAAEYVHQRLLAERERGAATLLISDDLDEVFSVCDRVAVIYEGRIVGEAAVTETTREQVGLWMSGVAD